MDQRDSGDTFIQEELDNDLHNIDTENEMQCESNMNKNTRKSSQKLSILLDEPLIIKDGSYSFSNSPMNNSQKMTHEITMCDYA